jgi:hypothetical protein
VSNGSTGLPAGGQAPAGPTPPGQNGAPNAHAGNGNGNGRDGREDLAVSRTGTRPAPAYGPNGATAPRTQPSANPVRNPSNGQARTPAPRTAQPVNPRPVQQPQPGGQRPAPATSWAPKGRRPGATPGAPGATQPGATPPGAPQPGPMPPNGAGRPVGNPSTPSPVAPNGRAGGQPGQAPNAAAAAAVARANGW